MNNDDEHVGHLLSRRQMVALLGSAGSAWAAGFAPWAAAGSIACVVVPEQTEGPFFLDRRLERSDIRSDSTSGATRVGVPLALSFHVAQLAAGECRPLSGAIVDIWQCDAKGTYSGVGAASTGANQQDFLRGYQRANDDGVARFVTIYPGRYPGRTVHIHFKVRTANDRNLDFTSQLYFDDTASARIHASRPYSKPVGRIVRNQDDGIFRQGGDQLTLPLRTTDSGYTADFAIALDLS